MDFHGLLRQRDALLRQARLANVAFAYARLNVFAARVAAARLRGPVTLRFGDPGGDCPWATLAAGEGSQAVIEEHFLDEDIIELADILTFLNEGRNPGELCFELEEIGSRFLPRLRRELECEAIPPGENQSAGA